MSREDQLGHRVRWLDAYRRTVAVAIAFLCAPVCYFELSAWLGGSQWPSTHVVMLVICASALVWWVIEVALAWQTAVWETEYDRLRHDRGLPAARLIVRK